MADSIPISDEQLMSELAGGNRQALATLVQRHQDKALALAYRTLRNSDLAEDVAQEAFIRVFNAASRYRPDARFTTWFYRIVVNLCLDILRRQAKSPVTMEEVPEEATDRLKDAPSFPLENRELTQAVEAALDKLSDRQRTVVALHRFEGMSHAQIAQVTGWSDSAIESLLVRAYQKLRLLLKDYRDDSSGRSRS